MSLHNNKRLIELLQIGANVASLIVAIVVLIMSFNTENRSAGRFQKQLEQSNKIARENIRPLLSISESGFTGIKLALLHLP